MRRKSQRRGGDVRPGWGYDGSPMAGPVVVILAAGHGTRMKSRTPKVLHDLCGKPLVRWPIDAALAAGASKVVVVGGPDRAIEPHLPDGAILAVQNEARGTGHAVLAAADQIATDDDVVVINGDVPLITAEAIADLAAVHAGDGAAATMATMVLDDPTGYGRVVRNGDGSVERVVETKGAGDASAGELDIAEVNTGVYAFSGGPLLEALHNVRPDNAQSEVYLPDALPVLKAAGRRIAAYEVDDPTLTLGVNDRADLAEVRMHAQRRIQLAHMRAGVTIVEPASTSIDVAVAIGQDTVLEPGTVLKGATAIGAGSTIGPGTTMTDATVGDGAAVRHSYVDGATIGARVSVGPFAYLRPGAHLLDNAKAGTFVEIKNSTIGEGTKVPHLSYIGDADVGPGTNLGAATITANYNNRTKAKNRTTIGANVKTSVDTTLVSPVSLGDGAYTAAGSVVTQDVPPGALAVARARQHNIEGYADRE
jgi:bifunctional UDP-N-acetylglucosamine pyrophosphorylase/glucosamine-1-phosphate N-acetyltransferase